MTFLTIRAVQKMISSGAPLLTSSTHSWLRVSSLARKSYSSGSAPSQTPLVGSPEWKAILRNFKAYNEQPPLSQIEIKENQRIYEMRKRMDQMADMLKNVMDSNSRLLDSNSRLHGEMNHIIELLTKQH